MAEPDSGRTVLGLAPVLAALAVILAIVLGLRLGALIGVQQPIWPLPGLYLVEMAVMPGAAFLALIQRGRAGAKIAWAAGGAELAFSALGAWSVGPFYFPGAALLLAAGAAAPRSARGRLLPMMGFGLAGAVAQTAIMLAAIALSR